MPSRILPPKASERKKRSRYPRPLRHAPAVGKRLQFFFRHECLSTQRVCGSARESHLGRIAFSAFPMVRTASGRIAETRHGGLDAAIQSCSAFRRDAVARTVVRDRRRTGRRRGPGRAVGGRGVVRRRCGRRGRLHDGAHCAWLGLAVVNHHRRTRSVSAAAPAPEVKPTPLPKPRPDAVPSARSQAPTQSAGGVVMPPAQSLE